MRIVITSDHIYFVPCIQICTKPIAFMLLTQELSMEHLSVVQMVNHRTSIIFQDLRQSV